MSERPTPAQPAGQQASPAGDAPASTGANGLIPSSPQDMTPRSVEDSRDYVAQIIGDEAQAGTRVQAGPMLKLMYDTAVAVAFRHCGQRPVLRRLDRIDLTRTISHLDLVRIEGRMVEATRSTMVVEVRASARPPFEREFTPTHVGYLTMAAVGPDGALLRVPPLRSDTPQGREVQALAKHRRAQIEERHNAVAWIDSEASFRLADVVEPLNAVRYDALAPEDTIVRVKGQLHSQSPYMDGRVLAGDLLEWLDRVANYTARHFTRNPHTVTLSVNDMVFRQPLHTTDRIELISRVVYVRQHTLGVAIDIIVHGLDGSAYPLETVEFFLLNYHRNGELKKVTTELELREEDQESLRCYLRARHRYAFWRTHPESHLTQVPH